jgi:hypothetical protein
VEVVVVASLFSFSMEEPSQRADAGAAAAALREEEEEGVLEAEEQDGALNRSDRCTPEPRNGSKPPENLLNASSKPFQAQTSPPCGQCMNQAKNAKNAT